MANFYLYFATILIWGTSFYAIRLQSTVAAEVSIFYRFVIASAILVLFCLIKRLPMRFPLRYHLRFALLGICLFNLNFLFIYYAVNYMTTGVVCVIFSSVVIFNMILGKLLLNDRFSLLMAAGVVMGIVGIGLVFLPEMRSLEIGDGSVKGLLLALTGTLFASVGMITSALNQKSNIPLMQSNAWGMVYGAGFMMLNIILRGIPFDIDTSVDYLGSLLYLALFASVLGFTFFLTLVGRIGAGKASYATVLFPMLGLALSAWLENYQMSLLALVGAGLALAGNALILLDKQR